MPGLINRSRSSTSLNLYTARERHPSARARCTYSSWKCSRNQRALLLLRIPTSLLDVSKQNPPGTNDDPDQSDNAVAAQQAQLGDPNMGYTINHEKQQQTYKQYHPEIELNAVERTRRNGKSLSWHLIF
ncbi:hypothetical protein [Plasticicumulans lactativorans]|uniref:hypothetical protein n=1 Tax=Plasticicumulans lactativorans TaxID=1133106 RepID=UPI001FB403FE|nr:hypothetical protein [Plasticicumulans lactativorans]